MDKLKLKLKDQVLYFDGFTQLELTTVISDLEDGTVKLANGVICSNEAIKKTGNYKRKDYLKGSKFEGWIKKYDSNSEDLYKAYLFKRTLNSKLETIKNSFIGINVKMLLEKEGLLEKVINISKSLDKLSSKCKQL